MNQAFQPSDVTESDLRPCAPGLLPIRATSRRAFGRTWLFTLLLCAIADALLSVTFLNGYTDREALWIDLLYRQKRVAMARRPGRRLVVVGGSASLYGIDAQLIERKLNIPCVNFATHAGLGLRYILDRAQRELRPGDTVLLVPEYGSWSDAYRDAPGPALNYLRSYDRAYLARMSFRESAAIVAQTPLSEWPRSVRGWQHYLRGDLLSPQRPPPARTARIDGNGDLRLLMEDRTPTLGGEFAFCADETLPSVQRFREFSRWCRDHDIRLLFSWPNIMQPDVPADVARPPDWLMRLIVDQGYAVLDRPLDACYPRAWFMDSCYHVDPCCRRIRTEALMRRLRPELGLAPEPETFRGIYLVCGRQHAPSPGNLFAQDVGVHARYLCEKDFSAFGGITPSQTADLVRRGVPVFTDSPDAVRLLAGAGLRLELLSRGVLSIEQWFARYPRHVVILAAAPGRPTASGWQRVVPMGLLAELQKSVAVVGCFGTGAYSDAFFVASGAKSVTRDLSLQQLTRNHQVLPAFVNSRAAMERAGGRVELSVDGRPCVAANARVGVAVIDPEMGALVDSAVFGDGSDVEIWRMDRVVLK